MSSAIECLPNELLHLTFSFLPLKDLKTMRLMKKYFADLCVDLLFSFEAHLVLTRESTERLVSMSHHPKIGHLITSLLYEATTLEKFDKEGWVNYVTSDQGCWENTEPRDPHRTVTLKDQYEVPPVHHLPPYDTEKALSLGWAAYGAMLAWQDERDTDDVKNQDIYQAISRFANLQTIKVYVGPLTEYGQRSFVSTLLTYRNPAVPRLHLPPPGLRNLSQILPASATEAGARSIMSRVQIMYLDEIAVSAFPDRDTPLALQVYTSLQWLQELRITLNTNEDENTWNIFEIQSTLQKGDICEFIAQATNLRGLDLGFTEMQPCEPWLEFETLSTFLGQHTWEHLEAITIRGCHMYPSYLLSFLSRHSQTLESISIDCATLRSASENPWAELLGDLYHLKSWKSIELSGELLGCLDGHRGIETSGYVLGWLPDGGRTENVNALYYKYTEEARRQVLQYAQHKTDVNPFDEGGAAHACATHVEGDFAQCVKYPNRRLVAKAEPSRD